MTDPPEDSTPVDKSAPAEADPPEDSAPAQVSAPLEPDPPYPPIGRAWFMVGILMLAYVFSFVDRQIFGLIVGPIKKDLDITDTQVSYLMGFSFALFYTIFGMPIGRLADRYSRRGIIAVGLFFWSFMTTGCGFARYYWQLLLLRVGVGVGEAALSPAAYSLITDSFPREKLATAISVYGTGIYLGSGLAYLLGGFVVGWVGDSPTVAVPILGEIRSWQVVFFIVGLPGIAFVLLMLTIREPIRRGVRMVKTASGGNKVEQLPLREVVRYIASNWKIFLCHNLGFALLAFSSYGTTSWIVPFFVRTHGWTRADAGKVYGAIVMIFGTLGILAGGRIADAMSRRGIRDAKMRVGVIAAVVWLAVGLFYPVVKDAKLAFLLLAPTVFFASMPFGVAPAAIQEMVPSSMRAQASSLYLFVINLIGLGIGPTAIALMTDFYFRDEMKLQWSLLTITTGAHLIAAVLLFAGLRPYRESLDRVEAYTKAHA